MLKGKVWGTTKTEIATPFCEVHSITVKTGGFCSWHMHERKWNAFSVIAGGLRILTKGPAGEEALDLGPGDVCSIPPGVTHRFVNITAGDCRGLEIYYPEELGEDIVRIEQGGRQ